MGLFSKLRLLFGGKGTNSSNSVNYIGIVTTKPSFFDESNVELNSQYCSCRNFLAKQFSMIECFASYKGEFDESMTSINRLLSVRPNTIQTPSEFLYTIASAYFGEGIAMVQIVYDENLKPVSLFPIDTSTVNISHQGKELFVIFYDQEGNKITLNANDLLIMVRKPTTDNPLFANDKSLDQVVKVINGNYTGLENAIIQSHLIRYIVNWPSVMKDGEKVREDFEKQINQDTNGLIVLTHGETVTPVTSQATYAKQPEMDDMSSEVYSYFGLTKAMLQSNSTDTQHHYMMQYDIMPFVKSFTEEATYKFFTKKEIGFGNAISCNPEPLMKSSLDTRYKIATMLKDSGYYTPNELRKLVGAEAIEGGDKLVHSLNFTSNGSNSEQETEHSDSENNKQAKEGDK
jgi:HK97 family phage portal protein